MEDIMVMVRIKLITGTKENPVEKEDTLDENVTLKVYFPDAVGEEPDILKYCISVNGDEDVPLNTIIQDGDTVSFLLM